MKPLSNDLRERMMTAIDNKEGSHRQIAARFHINVSTITRLPQLREQTESVEPRPHGGGMPPKVDKAGLTRLSKLVKEKPDTTLKTLKEDLGITGSIMAIWRSLKKLNITRKKKKLHATEQELPRVKKGRQRYLRRVEAIDPRKLKFIDESGVSTTITPCYGRAPVGERVTGSAPFAWETIKVIAGIGLDGVCAPMAFKCSMTVAALKAYVHLIMLPTLWKGDVVVIDNLKAHQGPEIRMLIEGVRATLLHLPPYSPDLSPIESMFSKFKECLRRIGARTRDELFQAKRDGLETITAQDILGRFLNVGLYATQS